MNDNKISVNKYDYIRSYTRCEQVNFLKNIEIEESIKANFELINNKNSIEFLQDDEDENDFESDSIDSYESYRSQKLLGEIINVDSLNIQNRNREIDPKIIEGIIIDKKAKEFIISKNNVDIIIDYDDDIYKNIRFDNFKAAQKVQKDIIELKKQNKSFILFQPTFVNKTSNGSIFITKCDAIVYKNYNDCCLIEVKGTTSTKIIHLLDFLFQKEVLDSPENEINISDYKLCLVQYCKAKRNEVPFVLVDTLNLTKNSPVLEKNKKKLLTEIDIENKKRELKHGKYHLKINDILELNLSPDNIILNSESKNENTLLKMAINKIEKYTQELNELISSFADRIDYLYNKKQNLNRKINLNPCKECKSDYKNCEYWLKCRELFKLRYKKGNKFLEPFIYSGNLIKFKDQLDTYELSKSNNLKEELHLDSKYSFYLGNDDKIFIDDANKLWDLLQSKNKRVYFDFESINTAIRPMDNVYPFNQTITQNSIVKTKNFYDEYYCEDMIKDPKYLDVNWIKSIIDNLYEGEDVWYIVYNKNFESTRLKDMIKLLNDIEYTKKANTIIDNIFDLADFFNPQKKLILLNDLHGFYSIKKVLELIPKNILQETKTISYHELEVYNGAIAQEVTTKRFFDLVDDSQWKEIETNLKKYCQNDVRAMIAVEKFIKTKLVI